MTEGLSDHVVGIAARTKATDELPWTVDVPFYRLRSRNLIHRVLPRSLRSSSPWSGDAILERALRQTKADRVLCHFGSVAVEHRRLWENTSIPLFVHFHGFDFMFDMVEPDGSGKRIHSDHYVDQVRRLARRAIFIANSKFCFEKLTEAGVPADRIRLNYIGVHPASTPRVHTIGRPRILHVGRLLDVKGADLTVKAFSIMRSKGVEATLSIVGDGPDKEKVAKACQESDYSSDISMLGSVKPAELEAIYRDTAIFTVHNRLGPVTRQEEALNVAVLEAMAHGIPVVGTRSGGVRETVVDGVTGFLGAPNDIESQASNLAKLAQNAELRGQMGLASWQRVKDEFAFDRQIEGLVRILSD